MERVRIGIIGTSWWADMVHLPSLASHDRADLVAICGRNQERAREMAAKYGVAETYADYRQMIAEAGLDAIVIVTPDDLHYSMVMVTLAKGLHVMCEKPLALNVAQTAEMLARAEEAGVTHIVYYTSRWLPHHRYFRRLIADGTIGRCLYFGFRSLRSGNLSSDRSYRWRDDRARACGVLGDLGSHMIDLCRYCIDEIRTVSASLAVHVPFVDPDHPAEPANDSALLTIETRRGAQGTIHVSRVAALSQAVQALTVHGEQGVLELCQTMESGVQITWTRPGEPRSEISLPDELARQFDANRPFPAQIRQGLTEQSVGDRLFIDSILEGTGAQPSFYDGHKTQQVIDAAVESAGTGRRVSLADA